jgi:hypothetical protein
VKLRSSPAHRPGATPCAQRILRWDTGTDRRWQTTLTVRFRPAGLDVETGRVLPDHFEAVLGNRRLPATSDLSARQMMPFELTIARSSAAAPTERARDRFTAEAVARLAARYSTDAVVRGYFADPVNRALR